MWFGRYSHKWASGQPTLCDSLYEIRKVLEFTGHSLLITKADLEVAISDTKIVDHSLCGCFILQGHGIGKLEERTHNGCLYCIEMIILSILAEDIVKFMCIVEILGYCNAE